MCADGTAPEMRFLDALMHRTVRGMTGKKDLFFAGFF